MVLDSPGLLCALTLFAAGIGAWLLSATLRAGARIYLRFAAMLFAALAISFPLGFSAVAALLLLPLAAGALVIAVRAQLAASLPVFTASLTLVLGLACGLGACLSGIGLLALVPTSLAGLVIIASGLNRGDVIAALAGAALALSALSSWNEDAQGGMFLFCAAALLGLARPRNSRANPLGARDFAAWAGAPSDVYKEYMSEGATNPRRKRSAPQDQLLRSSSNALREEPRLP
jgi:hypothetical protein